MSTTYSMPSRRPLHRASLLKLRASLTCSSSRYLPPASRLSSSSAITPGSSCHQFPFQTLTSGAARRPRLNVSSPSRNRGRHHYFRRAPCQHHHLYLHTSEVGIDAQAHPPFPGTPTHPMANSALNSMPNAQPTDYLHVQPALWYALRDTPSQATAAVPVPVHTHCAGPRAHLAHLRLRSPTCARSPPRGSPDTRLRRRGDLRGCRASCPNARRCILTNIGTSGTRQRAGSDVADHLAGRRAADAVPNPPPRSAQCALCGHGECHLWEYAADPVPQASGASPLAATVICTMSWP
ncbi:hypothetical protein FKP32DRAFT_1055249 [Trametes sanguinea]|nr:hypothetical protein FKP32DRAFT_1055249 [Trametes sanguinea]